MASSSNNTNIIGFWKPREQGYGFMSQWFVSPFVDDNNTQFRSAEHYMMYHKARVFSQHHEGNEALMQRILEEKKPSKTYYLGKRVVGFDQAEWDKHKFNVICKGNMLKFTQNQELRAKLLSTRGHLVAEASPKDTTYGVGFAVTDPEFQNPALWTGRNLLGMALMLTRDALLLLEPEQPSGCA